MALIIPDPFTLLKGCITVANFIRAVKEDASFMKNRCEQLSDHIDDLIDPLETLECKYGEVQLSMETQKFISKLRTTLDDCEKLARKCAEMGALAATIKALTKKAAYTEQFDRLEKKLQRMTLPATLVNLDHLVEMKEDIKQLKGDFDRSGSFKSFKSWASDQSASDSNAEDSTDGMCPECDECGSDIDHGTGFFHCNGCPFPGFDVCETCFPPREHEHHEVNFTYGVFPEFNPYKIGVACNICQQPVRDNMTVYHCTACHDPYFDVCERCYSPQMHDAHREHITSGVYPQYNPYAYLLAFNYFDQDRTGTITFEEFKAGAKIFEIELDEEKTRELFEEFDEDGNESIDLEEFTRMIRRMEEEDSDSDSDTSDSDSEVAEETIVPEDATAVGAAAQEVMIAAYCNVCRENVKEGDTFYHCEECPPPGFDLCAKCYNPFMHDKHSSSITKGTFPEYDPYNVCPVPVCCDLCNKTLERGMTFRHCTACPLEPGFDVCEACYSPYLHDQHKEFLQSGVYPQYNPYKKGAAEKSEANQATTEATAEAAADESAAPDTAEPEPDNAGDSDTDNAPSEAEESDGWETCSNSDS